MLYIHSLVSIARPKSSCRYLFGRSIGQFDTNSHDSIIPKADYLGPKPKGIKSLHRPRREKNRLYLHGDGDSSISLQRQDFDASSISYGNGSTWRASSSTTR